MSIQTYRIIGSTMVIPGIPGEFHADQEIDVDTETNTVVATRLIPATSHNTTTNEANEESPPATPTVHISLDGEMLTSTLPTPQKTKIRASSREDASDNNNEGEA